MLIKKSDQYKEQLKVILEFIAKDKLSAMLKFRKDLNIQINNIIIMPHKHRKSIYHSDENVRDMIYKGHTIIYKIYENHINIVEIFNQNLPVGKGK